MFASSSRYIRSSARRSSSALRLHLSKEKTLVTRTLSSTEYQREGKFCRTSTHWIGAAAAAAGIAFVTTTGGLIADTTTKLEEEQQHEEEEESSSTTSSRKNAVVVGSIPEAESTTLLNWSGTHEVQTDQFYEPESLSELEALVRHCRLEGLSLRPVGSSLSPNGIGFAPEGMVSLAQLDKILNVNTKDKTVTVQAGARVNSVVEALRTHNLTLPNLASIAEQQMGGFVSVGAHGTGATVGPVDHYVTKLKIVTPAMGTMTLTKEEHGELFHLAKVGLGCLGIIAEITMECIPAHHLVEHTFVLTRQEAKQQLQTLLLEHKHVRYMWIPYADAVVVVTNDPEHLVPKHIPRNQRRNNDESLKPLRQLLMEHNKLTATTNTNTSTNTSTDEIKTMGFGELRDALLALNPLDVEHVKQVNVAEAEFWKLCTGYQTKPSDQLLQFDCGGQQWVWEVAFPTGTLQENNHNDMDFMTKLLKGIEEEHAIPAHSPIEQRWSASSSSLMSPVHGKDDQNNGNGLHSWVGIIMYLPPADEENATITTQRNAITDRFRGPYGDLVRTIGQEVNYASHWAKLELPKTMWQLVDLQVELNQRYPLDLFKKAREIFDPKGILGNSFINLVLGCRPKRPTIPFVPKQQQQKKELEPTPSAAAKV